VELRSLAGRFRELAAETNFRFYRRKLESVASELEEAALDAETRDWMRADLKRAS